MAVTKGLFYLGPLGHITEMPSVARGSNPDASFKTIGGVHHSLSGRRTDDVFGVKKVWTLTWAYISEEQWALMHAAHLRLIRVGYRLVDTRMRNQLPASVAGTGGTLRNAEQFETSGGGGVAQFDATPPTALGGLLDSAIKMANHAANDYLWAAGQPVPLIAGSSYRYSAWVKGSGNARLAVKRDSSGISTGSTVALGGTWQRLDLVFTPGGSDTWATVGAQGLSAASEVHIMGMMVQLDDPALADWVPGFGAPEVVVDKLQHGYPYVGYHGVQAVFEEV